MLKETARPRLQKMRALHNHTTFVASVPEKTALPHARASALSNHDDTGRTCLGRSSCTVPDADPTLSFGEALLAAEAAAGFPAALSAVSTVAAAGTDAPCEGERDVGDGGFGSGGCVRGG